MYKVLWLRRVTETIWKPSHDIWTSKYEKQKKYLLKILSVMVLLELLVP